MKVLPIARVALAGPHAARVQPRLARSNVPALRALGTAP